MKKEMLAPLLIVAPFVLFAAGCSSDDGQESDSGGNGADAAPPADEGLIADLYLGDGAASCGPQIYPCGVTGTREGELVDNWSFIGFSDPDTFCKAAKDRQIDFSRKVELSFGDWFRPPANCPEKKKKLLWVMVSAGWCGPCVDESRKTMDQINAGAFPPEVDVVDILFEKEDGSEVTEEFAKTTWFNLVKLNYPLLLDPRFKMGLYFDRESVPFNMVIDLATMKIIFAETGNRLPEVGAAIQAFLKGN